MTRRISINHQPAEGTVSSGIFRLTNHYYARNDRYQKPTSKFLNIIIKQPTVRGASQIKHSLIFLQSVLCTLAQSIPELSCLIFFDVGLGM